MIQFVESIAYYSKNTKKLSKNVLLFIFINECHVAKVGGAILVSSAKPPRNLPHRGFVGF